MKNNLLKKSSLNCSFNIVENDSLGKLSNFFVHHSTIKKIGNDVSVYQKPLYIEQSENNLYLTTIFNMTPKIGVIFLNTKFINGFLDEPIKDSNISLLNNLINEDLNLINNLLK